MRKTYLNAAWSVALLTCLAIPASSRATGVAAQGAPASPSEPKSIKVEVILSRSQGAKKLSNAPFVLVVNAVPANPIGSDPRQSKTLSASLRAGVSTWTGRSISTNDSGKVSTVPEYQYVGTDIDCQADYREPGAYRLYLSLSDSSLMSTGNPDASSPGSIANVAALGVRRFSVSNVLLIRDGQTIQLSLGTDPITGDTVRADVTVTTIR